MGQTARKTYRHGNVRVEAVQAAYEIVARDGHENLSLRQVAERVGIAHRSLYNHFEDREALLDAVATVAYDKLAAKLRRVETAADYTRIYVRHALKNRTLYTLMTSRPHATMKNNPALQTAVHRVITEVLRVAGDPEADSASRRRGVMKDFMLIHGGITLYAAGILDLPNDEALIAELTALTAGG
jgi:AcrR family transcriptional regulator